MFNMFGVTVAMISSMGQLCSSLSRSIACVLNWWLA